MSKTALKGIAVATAVAIGAVTLAAPAEAGRRHHRHHGHNGGAAIAAAIIGLGIGAAIASRPSYYYEPSYNYRPYTYAPPRRTYYAPPAYAYRYAPPPWTPAWYRYCSMKWKSFDPASGTYQPLHGPRQLCR